MTSPVFNLLQMKQKIESYVADDRPLNLDEMKNLLDLLNQFNSHFGVILNQEAHIPGLQGWQVANFWKQAKKAYRGF